MSLLAQYKDMRDDQWQYYHSAKAMDFEHFSHDTAYAFIKSTYKMGAKDRIFDVGFHDRFQTDGKHEHTVALYFLGCLFSDLVNDKLRGHISRYIANTSWYDFKYTWFLTCLYHDTASVIEKYDWNRNCPSNLDFYLGKHNIQYNVFEQVWDKQGATPYTYSEYLIKNYFAYRVEHHHSIDHGILAGYLLYDRLVKNYHGAWEIYSKSHPDACKDDFIHEDLRWRKEHLAHFAIVADAIIAHNIWRSEDTPESKTIYQQYGLDSLIYDKGSRIEIDKSPLVFFLGLLDTIEPVKRFKSGQALRNFNMEYDTKQNALAISVLEKGDQRKYDSWLSGVNGMSDWLAVDVKNENNSAYTITIV